MILALGARGHGFDSRIAPFSGTSYGQDAMAERLRRWITNPMGFPRVGSNPTGVVFDGQPPMLSGSFSFVCVCVCVFFFWFFFFDVGVFPPSFFFSFFFFLSLTPLQPTPYLKEHTLRFWETLVMGCTPTIILCFLYGCSLPCISKFQMELMAQR